MKCDVCQNEYEGEGLCPVCHPQPEEAAVSETNVIASAEETAVSAAEETLPTEEATDPQNEAEATSDEQADRIPLPVCSEGFESGEEPKKGKKPMRTAAVVLLSVCLTLAFVCTFACAAFLGVSCFVKEADVLHIFHPYADPVGAEQVAYDCFDALFVDFDFGAYIDLLPPNARQSTLEQMASAQGYQDTQAFLESSNATQRSQYEEFVFTDIEAMTISLYTEKALAEFMETDYTSYLFNGSYTAEQVTAIANVQLVCNYAPDAETEVQQTSLSHLVAFVDGAWYLIA